MPDSDLTGTYNRDQTAYWRTLHADKRGDLDAVGYAALGRGFNRVTYALRRDALAGLLQRCAVRPQAVFEAAVGVGAYASLWQQLGVTRWIGVDISADAIADLQARYPASEFYVADVTRDSADFPAAVDLATAIDVLYHLPDDAAFSAALQHIARSVKPGGALVVSDVFTDVRRPVAVHVVRRPLAAYVDIVQPLGFHLEARAPVFSILGDPVVVPYARVRSRLLFEAWRVLQKSIRVSPAVVRDRFGAAVAAAAQPLDRALRNAGVAEGVNLELSLFRRAADP